MKVFTPAIIAASLLASGAALAADKETVLSSMQGQVMINQGQAYVQATESMLLYPGDRLMVMRGGSAQMQFANGCVQTLQANEIATVGTAESCSSLQSAGTHNQVGSPASTPGGTPPPPASGVNPGGVVVATIAGAGLLYGVTEDNDDNRSDPPPASP